MIRSFPWHRLPRTSRGVEVAGGAIQRLGEASFEIDKIASALSELVGCDVTLGVAGGWSDLKSPLFADGFAITLSSCDAADRTVVIEVERPLGLALVARGVRRPAPRVVSRGSDNHADAVAGGIAAIVGAALRRCARQMPLHVVDASTTPNSETLRSFTDGGVTLPIAMRLGSDMFAVRVHAARSAFNSDAPDSSNQLDCAALGEVPLALSIVMSEACARANEVAALAVGDVWIGETKLVRSDRGELEGGVWLAAPRGEIAIGATIRGPQCLAYGGEPRTMSWNGRDNFRGEGAAMDNENGARLIEALADTPIVVRIEIGTIEMTAREWNGVKKGAIVSSGAPIGAMALLRAGGIEIARGELVDVDGELGVRILERL